MALSTQAICYDDSPEAFPLGTIRVVNFSIADTLAIIGEERIKILPGQQTIVRPPEGVVSLKVAVQKDGDPIPTLNTARKVEPTERLVLAIFDWDVALKAGETTPPPKAALFYLPKPAPAESTPSAATIR